MMSSCNFPYDVNLYIIIYCMTLIVLFVDFYFNAYRQQKQVLPPKLKQTNGIHQPKKILRTPVRSLEDYIVAREYYEPNKSG